MAIPAVQHNTPSAGYISWAGFNIQFNGVLYTVPAASSNQRWVWWAYNGGSPVLTSGADLPPTLTDDDLVLFANRSGIAIRIQSTNFLDGELLVDGTVLADAIATNQINSQHIVTLGLDAGVIKFGVMSGDRISVNTLLGDRILANSIAVSKLSVVSLDNIIEDPGFTQPIKSIATGGFWQAPGTGGMSIGVGEGRVGGNAMKFLTDGLGKTGFSPLFPVSAGRSYRAAYWIHSTAALNAGAFNLALRTRKPDGTTLALNSTLPCPAIPADTWTLVTGFVSTPTNPADTSVADIRMTVAASAPVGATIKIDAYPSMTRANAGELVVDGSIIGQHLAADTITANQIAAGAVTVNELAADAVTAVKIAAGAVVAGKIAADAVTAVTIAAGAVVAGKIAADAVTATTIAAGAVIAGKIAADAVTAVTIAANAVVAGKIATDAVTAGTIAANAITAVKIATDAVEADKIKAGAVTTVKLDAQAVTADKIAASTISGDKINATFLITGKTIKGGTVLGASIQTSQTANTGPRMEMNEDVEGGFIKGFIDSTGIATYAPTKINPRVLNTGSARRQSLYLSAGAMGGGVGSVDIISGSIDDATPPRVILDGETYLKRVTYAEGNLRVTAGQTLIYEGYIAQGASDGAKFNASGSLIRTDVSSRKFKKNVRPLSLKEAEKALGMEPVTFVWKREMDLGDDRHAGFIAEQAAEVDADQWVQRDQDGVVSGVRYSELPIAHHVLIRNLLERVAKLEK